MPEQGKCQLRNEYSRNSRRNCTGKVREYDAFLARRTGKPLRIRLLAPRLGLLDVGGKMP
jgi:hypothetical protein